MRKELGKIESVTFGFNEYLFGLSLVFSGQGWGVATDIYYNPTYKEINKTNERAIEVLNQIQKLLKDAKVDTVDKLKNKPIEATFEGNVLKDYRILTEVL